MSKPGTVRAIYSKVVKVRPSGPAAVKVKIGMWEDLACVIGLADCLSGVVYHRCPEPVEIGGILPVPTVCMSNSLNPHQWIMHMRILRRAKISEVRKMARLWGGPTPLVKREGLWYEVHCD